MESSANLAMLKDWKLDRGKERESEKKEAGVHRPAIKDASDSFSEIGIHLAQAALKLST